jgi:hypothetical protein
MRNARQVLVGKPEGKRPLRRSRDRRKVYIKSYLREIRWEVVGWNHLAPNGSFDWLLWLW